MDSPAEGPTPCDNHVWTACDKQNVVNNPPTSVRQISTSDQLSPAQMNPFSAPKVSLIWGLNVPQERVGAGPEHASHHSLEQRALHDRSTGAGCALGSESAFVAVAVAPPRLDLLPSNSPSSGLVCGATAIEGAEVTLLMGKHKGKRARVLGPAKKKYRVQVEGLDYQLEYYPAALGLPELKADPDSILVTSPSDSTIIQTVAPPGSRISCDGLQMAPAAESHISAAEDKGCGGDTLRPVNESATPCRKAFPLDGYQSWVGHRLRVKRGKYQGKYACVLSLASAKLRVSVEDVDYQLEFYPAMFDPPPGWTGSLTEHASMNGRHSILNGQHAKTSNSSARDKQNASTPSRANQIKANAQAVKSPRNSLNAKGSLSPRSKGIAKSPRSKAGRSRSSASPRSAISGKVPKDGSLVGIHLARTASNRSISVEVDQHSTAVIKTEDINLTRNTSTNSCANHHPLESIVATVMEVDGLECGSVQGQHMDVDEPSFSAGFSALLHVASSILGKTKC